MYCVLALSATAYLNSRMHTLRSNQMKRELAIGASPPLTPGGVHKCSNWEQCDRQNILGDGSGQFSGQNRQSFGRTGRFSFSTAACWEALV